MGAGLISGAVVHHPMDPTRYSLIAGAGVLVFLVATFLNEVVLASEKPALVKTLRVLGASTMLSFGLGMLSGGMQHFADLPDRCAVLIPVGLVLAFVAYFLKEDKAPWRRIFGLMGLAVLVVAALSFAGLRHIAPTMGEAGGGHSHGNAVKDKSDEEGRDGDSGTTDRDVPPGDEPTGSAPEPTAPADTHHGEESGHEDGHDH
ncbi:hypothetical protein J7E88_34640 [Streptomyces sp. ISL-10]|uniref:hypothetical protein n=1 Tax=Streptomyces sp. ISL-10 TaxID=2819172 RepID=UPI001BE5FB51|nr:hypothetical protein [Streptomyces sp. ISL-10]MBT2370275.1 hypothetical protein [Streptomyces sp. ISL-10]